jgi:hypothetical protein
MTHDELRALVAAIILSGQLAGESPTKRDVEIQEAIAASETLLEALKDPAPRGELVS